MDFDKILELVFYTIPALITGGVAFYFFREFVHNESNRRRFLLQREMNKETLPIRLQAYERMALFLERISPSKLLIRVNPTSSDKESYESLLVANIEQEFEHNLSQQIYLSDECWNVINAAKNATIQLIRKAGMQEKSTSANKLREVVLEEMLEKQPPSNAALSYVKQEVGEIW